MTDADWALWRWHQIRPQVPPVGGADEMTLEELAMVGSRVELVALSAGTTAHRIRPWVDLA